MHDALVKWFGDFENEARPGNYCLFHERLKPRTAELRDIELNPVMDNRTHDRNAEMTIPSN